MIHGAVICCGCAILYELRCLLCGLGRSAVPFKVTKYIVPRSYAYRRPEANFLKDISDFNVVKLFAKHLFATKGIEGKGKQNSPGMNIIEPHACL